MNIYCYAMHLKFLDFWLVSVYFAHLVTLWGDFNLIDLYLLSYTYVTNYICILGAREIWFETQDESW